VLLFVECSVQAAGQVQTQVQRLAYRYLEWSPSKHSHAHAGTELYPRIGRHFDIKTWTNCRMGMMAWTFIAICCAFKQRELTGTVANSMLVSVILQGAFAPASPVSRDTPLVILQQRDVTGTVTKAMLACTTLHGALWSCLQVSWKPCVASACLPLFDSMQGWH
jgi:hypothetical protein